MAGRKMSRGKCNYCQEETPKNKIAAHFSKCAARQEAVTKAESGKAQPEKCFYLRVQDAHLKDFWLDLEIRGSASLQDLDVYLRGIWLECCGHLSQFTLESWGDEISMKHKIEKVFKVGTELTHIYDFGTSSETLVKAVNIRSGKPTTRNPIALLARNLQPEEECLECGKKANYFCIECVYENDKSGMLCAEHAESHPHDDYGEPVQLVNSPRMGMCGYEGPADPPY